MANNEFITDLKLDGFESFTFGRGPLKAAVTAGIHGDEQTSVYAAGLLMDFLSRETLRGSVIVAPLCNPAAFRKRARETPFDGADLNRSFCKTDGVGFSASLAKKIWNAVSAAPFLLDLHCCGQHGSLYVMCMHGTIPSQRGLARVLGIPHVVQSSEAAGQLFVHINREGKQSLLIEMPGGQPAAVIDADAARTVFDAAIRFLAHSGVISEDSPAIKTAPGEIIFHGKIKRVCAERNALFVPAQKAGTHLNAGDVIGNFGGAPCVMPFDGTLLAIQPMQYIFEGDRMFTAAPFEGKEIEA